MATNTDVLKAIEKLDGKVDTLNEMVITHLAKDEGLCKTVDQLHLDVNGNGKRGLKVDVEELKAWVGGSKKLAWIMVTAAVGSLAGGLITVLSVAGK